jgi:hypothetical protein
MRGARVANLCATQRRPFPTTLCAPTDHSFSFDQRRRKNPAHQTKATATSEVDQVRGLYPSAGPAIPGR